MLKRELNPQTPQVQTSQERREFLQLRLHDNNKPLEFEILLHHSHLVVLNIHSPDSHLLVFVLVSKNETFQETGVNR